MKGSLVALIGLGCFAAGLGTGRLWQSSQAPAGPVADLPAKSPRPELADKTAAPTESRKSPAKTAGRTAQPGKAAEVPAEAQTDFQREHNAYERVKSLVADATQREDHAKHRAAIEAIRQALASDDPELILGALQAYSAISELMFDRSKFRGVLLPLVDSEDTATRRLACFGLMQSKLEDSDRQIIAQVAREKGFGDRTCQLLAIGENYDLTGDSSAELVRGWLARKDPAEVKIALNGIHRSKLSPALEADVLALSRQDAYQHDAVYFVLSSQWNKSEATVQRLIEVMNLPDKENAARAAWGLGHGVPKEFGPMIADAAIKVVASGGEGGDVEECWNLMFRYAGAAKLDQLRQLAALPDLSEKRKGDLDKQIARLEASARARAGQ